VHTPIETLAEAVHDRLAVYEQTDR